MNKGLMYPLRFEPIYQYRVWGGRRLAKLLKSPLPRDGPVGEAWLLSDRDDHASKVAAGPLEGSSLAELLARFPDELMGKLAGRFRRFPLLLKFLDAQEKLSVQVHPTDRQKQYLPAGETGKTEAWVVIESGPESQIYAGLKPGTTRADLERVLANRTVADLLSVHAQTRRRCVDRGRNSALIKRRGRLRGAGKQRRDVSALRLGSRRPENGSQAHSPSRTGHRMRRFCTDRDRSGQAGRRGSATCLARAAL